MLMERKWMRRIVPLSLLLISLLCGPVSAEPDNQAALGAGRDVRTVYDVNIASAKKLALYLEVIERTHADLKKAGVAPRFVVALRGPAVRLVSTATTFDDPSEQDALQGVSAKVARLARLGVRFEACNIATSIFGVDPATLLPGVKEVGNTFVSLIGYQEQGYALVPIM